MEAFLTSRTTDNHLAWLTIDTAPDEGNDDIIVAKFYRGRVTNLCLASGYTLRGMFGPPFEPTHWMPLPELAVADPDGRTFADVLLEHWSDCAVNRGPALEPGPCDCGATIRNVLTAVQEMVSYFERADDRTALDEVFLCEAPVEDWPWITYGDFRRLATLLAALGPSTADIDAERA